MSAYDSHRVMLDSGLTALALRALHERDGHYPFIDRHAPRRRSRSGYPGPLARRERASQWWGLFRRLLAPRLRTLGLQRAPDRIAALDAN